MSNQKQVKKIDETNLLIEGLHGLPSGFEGTSNETFKTPFLRVLQDISPEVKKKGEAYIDGAEGGMFFNTATNRITDELNIIVLKISHDLVVWQPNRGGFVGTFPKSAENSIVARRDGAKKFDENENEIVDTISFFCVNADDPSDLFVFPLSGASLKHAKTFSTRIRTLKIGDKVPGVSFIGVWNIKTVLESNDKGSWYSIGNTPQFVRAITSEELNNVIKPALNLIDKSETDYKNMEAKTEESEY